MPQSSLIIGVDLVAIKPIPNVITFQDDITTDRCRQNLRQEMKTWKADVVLHDGAPNVGAAWAHDAFTQSELVLVSLKLATEFLCKGGTFVTKVFRSKDYNKLIWVFQQLFKKVEATKPPSSRGVSAEIFVVCREFIAPKKLDPRFLDPKAVFSELNTDEPTTITDIFKPEKTKRQREGYEDGNYTLFKSEEAIDFIHSQDAVAILGKCNQLSFKTDASKALLNSKHTTEDVIANCEDLKVLGKREFKTLMKWRSHIREELGLDKKEKPVEIQVEEEELNDEEKLEAELENLTKEEALRRKRLRRKNNEKKMKLIHRMQLNMIVPSDIGLEQEGTDGKTLFNMKKIKQNTSLKELQKGDMDLASSILEDDEDDDEEISALGFLKGNHISREMDLELIQKDGQIMDSDEEDEALDNQLDEEYQRFIEQKEEKNAKMRAKRLREGDDEWQGFDKKRQKGRGGEDEFDDDISDDSDSDNSDSDAPSNMKGEGYDESESESEDDNDDEQQRQISSKASKKKHGENSLLNDLGKKSELSRKTASGLSMGASLFFDQDIFADVDKELEEEEDEDDDDIDMDQSDNDNEEEEENDGSDFEIVKEEDAAPSDDEMWSGDEDETSIAVRKAKEKGLLTAEAVTLARQIVNKEKTTTDLIDEGFSREGFRDKEGLPSWFLDDEGKHNKPNIPITKEAVNAIREKLRALDARPIKKIAEAKARKKHKTMKRLQKAQKKANDIVENPEMSEKEKLTTINKIIQRSTKSKPKKEVKLVVAKGQNRGIQGRPSGVKGRYKMVDSRMKKELRAAKRKEKKKSGRR
ncbi:unnamed protein product [Cunninghamella echinulata]